MASLDSVTTTLNSLREAGSPKVPFTNLPAEVQIQALSLYKTKVGWACCKSLNIMHGHNECAFMTDIPQPLYYKLRCWTTFENLVADKQFELVNKYFKVQPSGKYRWNCCNSSSQCHMGNDAAKCNKIHNLQPISTLEMITSAANHPLITQAQKICDDYKTEPNSIIRACVRHHLQLFFENPPALPISNNN